MAATVSIIDARDTARCRKLGGDLAAVAVRRVVVAQQLDAADAVAVVRFAGTRAFAVARTVAVIWLTGRDPIVLLATDPLL